jgi:hypothetical protein
MTCLRKDAYFVERIDVDDPRVKGKCECPDECCYGIRLRRLLILSKTVPLVGTSETTDGKRQYIF